MLRARVGGHQRREFLADGGAMHGELTGKRIPIRTAERERDALANEGVVRESHASADRRTSARDFRVGAGNGTRRARLNSAPGRNETELLARRERRQQAARTKRRLAAAADQLYELHDELDLADAAGSELEIVGEILARDFGIDQRLHLAQSRERRVIEIAAKHERPQRIE